MLNITQLLQDAIYFDNQVIEQRDLLMGPTAHLQEIVVRCDQSLADLYQPAINYSIVGDDDDKQLSHEQLLQRFVQTVHWFLLFSARKQWTHLVVMDDQQYQQLLTAKRATKLSTLDQEYLAIKYFLFTSFYTHRQEDFRHAWHLLLKDGLVDLQLTPEEIMQEHERVIKENLKE
ncbi:dUTPase [Limosilactobacillus caecicola]|uniref:dUTPase n=1 Tax=Limosilactobacillus caecicola TaxID=2941332 RepID=UPI00203FA71A|nr:dUTPase [Limosilactobacillus caecicola]